MEPNTNEATAPKRLKTGGKMPRKRGNSICNTAPGGSDAMQYLEERNLCSTFDLCGKTPMQ